MSTTNAIWFSRKRHKTLNTFEFMFGLGSRNALSADAEKIDALNIGRTVEVVLSNNRHVRYQGSRQLVIRIGLLNKVRLFQL